MNLFEFGVDFYIAFAAIALLITVEFFEEYSGLYGRMKLALNRPVKWVVLTVIILLVLILGVWQGTDFLYFQF